MMFFQAFVLYLMSIIPIYLDKFKSSFILRCIDMHLEGSAVIKILLLLLKGILKRYFNGLRIPNYCEVMTELIAIQNNRA